MLTAKGVSYWYDSEENTLYKDVNLNFEAGQLYGIIGSSGAGKTTLLTMLAGLDKPRKGEILYEGTSLQKIGLTQYRNRYVSIVFQAYNLLPYMSALDNVLTAMAITHSEREYPSEFALEMLTKVGINLIWLVKTFRNYPAGSNNGSQSSGQCVVMHQLLSLMNQLGIWTILTPGK